MAPGRSGRGIPVTPGTNLGRARFLAGYRRRAQALLRDPRALDELTTSARTKASGSPSSKIRDLAEQVKLLGRLVRAYAAGTYRDIAVRNIVLVVAAILYFVTPIDLIPDAIPGAGLIDDASILAFVLATLDGELARFAVWEKAQAIDVTAR